VTDKNYVKHSRGGKVVGALLSRVTAEETVDEARSPTDAKRAAIKRAARNFSDARRAAASVRAANAKSPYKVGEPQMNAAKAFGWVKESADLHLKRAKDDSNYFEVTRVNHSGLKDNLSSGDRIHKSTLKGDKYSGYSTKIVEDVHDLEGARERVNKTKKRVKKKLHELNTSTLARYVTKAIEDRKKAASGRDMAHRIHTPERAAHFDAEFTKRIAKRAAGIKTAVGKIASMPLHDEPLAAHSAGEGSKHGGWSGMESKDVNWQRIATKHFSVLSTKHGGESLKSHMARLAAVGIPSRKSHSPYQLHVGLEVPARHEKKASKILYDHTIYIDEQPINEGRNEYDANLQMAASTSKPAKGHYLMRDGRRLSGPHTPDEAVRKYKDMNDSKGVKIVHVKEDDDKYKKAVMKAVSLKKKAKGNKHVDTEPKLNMPDKGTSAPLEGTSSNEVADDAKL